MKHGNSNRKFGRKANVRNALIRSLACSLIIHESIKTTEAKAKELRPFIEKLITNGRSGTVAARRLVLSRLHSDDCSQKLVSSIAPRYKERPGGYTRITKLPIRKNDSAKMAQIEFV